MKTKIELQKEIQRAQCRLFCLAPAKSAQKILLFLILLRAFSAQSADRITAIVTVTNAPTTNHMQFVVNGNTRLWTNAITSDPAQILTNNSIGGIATNLFNQISRNPYTGPVRLYRSSTNDVRLEGTIGQAMVVSLTGNWGSISYSTQSVAGLTNISVPLASWPTPSSATNAASSLITGLNVFSLTALNQNQPVSSELVGLTNSQTISGNKTFTGATTMSNNQIIVGGVVTNLTHLTAIVGRLTNGFYQSPTNINPVATNSFTLNFGGNVSDYKNFKWSEYPNGFLFERMDDANTSANETVMQYTLFDSAPRLYFPVGLLSPVYYIGDSVDNYITNNTGAVGYVATGTHTFTGRIYGESSLTNNSIHGTNNIHGDIALLRLNNTSLANGNNAGVDPGTSVYVKVSGPSAAFAINGLAGGRNGRVLVIQNSTGQTMTIANDSGTDPTAANRILTGTAADVTVTNNPGSVTLFYDSAVARWIITAKTN